MNQMIKDTHREKLMGRVCQAFMDHGYDQLTMIGLAKACWLTRRALYHHFSGKEEAFREMLRWFHRIEIAEGFAAGERILADGGGAVDAIVAIFEARYGRTRRDVERSPHALEINHEAFRRGHDVIAASAAAFQERLAGFLGALTERGVLRIRKDYSVEDVAQFLCDGARGVNQSMPLQPAETLPQRTRKMSKTILYGCATQTDGARE